jgi:hypothetical protein
VPSFLALHNLEEALTFPRYLPTSLGISYSTLLVALLIATVVPFIVTIWAQVSSSIAALRCVLLIQAVVALNVVWHVAVATTVFHGYVPGVVTAVLINLPFSVYLLRRAVRERWWDA